MIRQAISCDICGSEKKQTNHWFVVHDRGGELRISGWNSRNRLRPGSRHLCGQTCLHKLVDDFMAKSLAVRVQPGSADEAIAPNPLADERPHVEHALARPILPADTSLTAASSSFDLESSAQLTTPPSPVRRPPFRAQPELVPMPQRPQIEEPPPLDEPPRFASRNWRAEAWDRERERELRAKNSSTEIAARRRSGS